MAKQKPKPAQKPKRTDSVSVQFYCDHETVAAFDAYLATLPPDLKVKKRGILVAALRNYLAAKGHWPPPPAEK